MNDWRDDIWQLIGLCEVVILPALRVHLRVPRQRDSILTGMVPSGGVTMGYHVSCMISSVEHVIEISRAILLLSIGSFTRTMNPILTCVSWNYLEDLILDCTRPPYLCRKRVFARRRRFKSFLIYKQSQVSQPDRALDAGCKT